MPKTIQEIKADPNFQALPLPEQQKVINTVLLKDAKFVALPDIEKEKVKTKLMPTADIIEAEDMTDDEILQYQLQDVQNVLKKQGDWDNAALMPAPESKLKTFGRAILNDLPENAGATAGSLVGAKYGSQIPVPPQFKGVATVGGALAGAYIGGASGRGYKETWRQLTDKEPPMAISEIYKSMNRAGAEQLAYELAGRGIAKIGKTAMGAVIPPPKRVISGSQEADSLLRQYGGQLTPAQATEHFLTDKLEDVAEGSFFGGDKIYRLKNVTNMDAIRKMTTALTDDFALKAGNSNLSSVEVGDLVLDTIQGGNVAFKKAAQKMYKVVDDLAKPEIKKMPLITESESIILDSIGKPMTNTTTKLVNTKVGGATVDMKSLKKFASSIQSQMEEAGSLAPTQKRLLTKKILDLPDTVTFEGAQEIRSDLRQLTDQLAAKGDETKGLARKFHQLSTFEMTKSAKNLPPDAYGAWRAADEFYREGKIKFNNKLIRGLTKKLDTNPEIIADWLKSPNAISQAQKLKEVVPPQTWNKVKYLWLEDFITTGSNDGLIKADNLINKMSRQKNIAEIFTPAEIGNINKVLKAASLAQGKTGAKGGKMLIQLTQAGALFNLATFNQAKEGTYGVLITPAILAHLYTNPKTAKWLAMGHTLPAKTPEAAALAARIIGEASKVQSLQNELDSKRINDVGYQSGSSTMAEQERLLNNMKK